MIPFYSFQHQHEQIRHEALKAMEETYDSNWYILGERLKKFEQEFSNYTGVAHTLGVGNGLEAIRIALRALDIKEGDEVIVPANTYIATVLAVTELGASPVLVEPDLSTYNIDTDRIEEKITKKTKAIIPVHLYGLPCEMDVIQYLATKHSLAIIEDNAQAVGAVYKNKKTGSFGTINATSFYPTKTLGALGDGGAITTQDEALAKKVALLRNYGSEKKYYNEIEGYNSRLDEMQAAVLSVKLNYLDQWNNERIRQADYYTQAFSEMENIQPPVYEKEQKHVFHLYVIRSSRRDELMQHLEKNGIQTAIHYPVPAYRQNAYKYLNLQAKDFPITEKIAAECLSLPLYPGLSRAEQDQVIEAIKIFK
ncbi:MAG TPA: DegT/DnrJ/EryC1/StrS family aminotransferase [Cytophagaceae bacterium]|nr:DegT/DnrJ/EryC1/StrS family aminotransferase [Cytophagaceae bacterium]